MKYDGLRSCSRKCMADKKICKQKDCRMFIEYADQYNCCLISIYENDNMTLREIGERLGISFARVKQIESAALVKLKGNSLFS